MTSLNAPTTHHTPPSAMTTPRTSLRTYQIGERASLLKTLVNARNASVLTTNQQDRNVLRQNPLFSNAISVNRLLEDTSLTTSNVVVICLDATQPPEIQAQRLIARLHEAGTEEIILLMQERQPLPAWLRTFTDVADSQTTIPPQETS